MDTFDPWPIVTSLTEESQAKLELTEMQRLQLQLAMQLREEEHRPRSGFEVMQAVAACIGAGIPVPEWLARDFGDRFRAVTTFAAGSFDSEETFGPMPALPAGSGQLRTAYLRHRWVWLLNHLFTNGGLKRTDAGYATAAKKLGLTPVQVKSLLPKTRKNTRGHKPLGGHAWAGLPPHNWFSARKVKVRKR